MQDAVGNNPSVTASPRHLPLHKGGFGLAATEGTQKEVGALRMHIETGEGNGVSQKQKNNDPRPSRQGSLFYVLGI